MQSPKEQNHSSRLYDILMKLSSAEEVNSTSSDGDPKERFAQLSNRLLLNPSLSSTRKRHIDDSSRLSEYSPQKRTKEAKETTQDASNKETTKQPSLEESETKATLEKDDIAALEKEVEEESNTRRQEFMEKMKGLRSLYLHGLQRVSQLQDLRDAPDAILPGNHIVPATAGEREASAASASSLEKVKQP